MTDKQEASSVELPEPDGYLCRNRAAADQARLYWPSREPDHLWRYTHGAQEIDTVERCALFDVLRLYTAAKIEAYAAAKVREALEEAARECDEVRAEAEQWASGADPGMYDHQAQGVQSCAEAIRALKDKKP